MAQIYTLDGLVQPLDTKDNAVFFRKMCDLGSLAEKQIAQLLLNAHLSHVVAIHDVRPSHIDMELLDVYHDETSTQETDIRMAVQQLHTIGVVYVDIKSDNFGYSHANGCWKLFDFDGSGLLKEGKLDEWELAPANFYIYKRVAKQVKAEGRPLVDIDALALESFFRKQTEYV